MTDIQHRYHHHWGDDGRRKMTVESVQDVEPIIRDTRIRSETDSKDFRFKATIPGVVIDEAAKIHGALWGVTMREAWREIAQAKTDRAKCVWKTLSEGRDFRKFQRT